MINPQLEKGYLKIANEIVKKFKSYRISGDEWLVLWTILSKTYGFNKKEDYIPITQFEKETGLKRANVYRAIKKLLSKKIIGIIKNDNSQINLYRFNKLINEWTPIIKKNRVLSKKIIEVLSKKIPSKDNIKDNTIIPKGITKAKPSEVGGGYGNKEITFLIGYLKERLGLPILDDTEKVNRRYCWLLLRKFKGEDKVKLLIDATASHTFWSTRITSFKQLYYKAVNIISSGRDNKFAVTKL